MQKIGIQAIYSKRKTSIANKEHRVFPYLLRDMKIEYPNQVWATDITYIRMHPGWLYLVAIMDWYSRYVIRWEISNTMDVHFCLESLGNALSKYKPDILNSDQASQFTSRDFTGMLEASGVRISMDGRGRVYDNIFIEHLWRTVKYENIYLCGYQNIPETKEGLKRYFEFYNRERFHQSLDYRTPWQVYSGVEAVSPLPVFSHCAPVHTQDSRCLVITLLHPQTPDYLSDIQHPYSPSCHDMPSFQLSTAFLPERIECPDSNIVIIFAGNKGKNNLTD